MYHSVFITSYSEEFHLTPLSSPDLCHLNFVKRMSSFIILYFDVSRAGEERFQVFVDMILCRNVRPRNSHLFPISAVGFEERI